MNHLVHPAADEIAVMVGDINIPVPDVIGSFIAQLLSAYIELVKSVNPLAM